ncbi:MAG: DUF2207 domain-containing protein [Candidatus Wallbacteria bacterium]|nr:DUF2207 domain-containing protein [Candidatus Wallbacteria bacterium]
MKIFLFLFIVFIAASAGICDHIQNYLVNIEINPDDSILIYEKIRVQTELDEIRHGICRDFPVSYVNSFGLTKKCGFSILSIEMDGNPESYEVERTFSSAMIVIGSPDRILSRGIHTYDIKFKLSRVFGIFTDHDELYFNAIGNGWNYPILSADVNLTIPQQFRGKITSFECFGGKYGSREQILTTENLNTGYAVKNKRVLQPLEGITFVLGWPKGLTTAPPLKFQDFVGDNLNLFIGLVGTVLLLCYFLLVWYKVGQDPRAGSIFPRFEGPAGISPAAARFLINRETDNQSLLSAIISMAVKGYLKINVQDKSYSLEKTGTDESRLSDDEMIIAKEIFSSADKLKVGPDYSHSLSSALIKLDKYMEKNWLEDYYSSNFGCFIIGLSLSLITWGLMILYGESIEAMLAITLILVSGNILTSCAIGAGIRHELDSNLGLEGPVKSGLYLSLGIVCTILNVWLIYQIVQLYDLNPAIAILITLISAIDTLFFFLLPAPTLKGLRLIEELLGLKMFLGIADADRFSGRSPELNKTLFERNLPYALALDVEIPWGEKFTAVLAQAEEPSWYTGGGRICYYSFPKVLNSGFNSVVANSISSGPSGGVGGRGSFSSRSGGRGFSGGGRGGGGGRGW